MSDDFVRGLMWVKIIAQQLQPDIKDVPDYWLACNDIINAIDAKMEDLANQETRYEPGREI